MSEVLLSKLRGSLGEILEEAQGDLDRDILCTAVRNCFQVVNELEFVWIRAANLYPDLESMEAT